jgi:site-specific DNA-cytosine methylase
MSTVTHFISLIGPWELARRSVEKELDIKVDHFLSLSPFKNHEAHLVKNFPDIQFKYLDELHEGVKQHIADPYSKDITVFKNCAKDLNIAPSDIQLSIPPCAGLCMLNAGNRGADNAANRWMYESVKWFLAQGSTVLCFENAPGLLGAEGLKVLNEINEILKFNGLDKEYKFHLTKTTTSQHGIPQNRARAFAYLYKKPKHMLFKNISKKAPPLEEWLDGFNFPAVETPDAGNDHIVMRTNWNTEFEDLINMHDLWKYMRSLTQETEDDSKSFSSWPVWLEMYKKDKTFFGKYEKMAKKAEYMLAKLADGKGFWDSSPIFAKGRTNAIVSKNAFSIVHPKHNRYLTIRELMCLMGYPTSFRLIDPVKNFNHICQSLPICTGADHLRWAHGIATGDPRFVTEAINTNDTLLLQNNMNGNLENDVAVCEFVGPWKPFAKPKISKLKSFVK